MIKIITTGCFYADGGAMFGAIPKVTWSRSYPVNERNLCVLAMHTGLVTTADGRVIVVDPGVRADCLNDSPAIYYKFHEMRDLCEELAKAGIMPEDVTDVVFTHLHFDHCGGAVRKNESGVLEPVFKNAEHWVGRAQYDSEKRPHPLEKDSFTPDNTAILEAAGLLRVVEATMKPCDSMTMRLYDGHTKGQIALNVSCATGIVVFPGDIIPLSSHIVPERISAYDLFPVQSYNGKLEILEEAASNESILVFYHDALVRAATIKKVRTSFKISKKADI